MTRRSAWARHARDTAFVLLELGGAFTAAIAVQAGQVVDGIGGSSGPIGWQAAGALDGEVAYLAGTVDKAMLFQGGVTTVAASDRHAAGAGFDAFIEGAVKAVRQLLVSAPLASEVLVSGRIASDPAVRERLAAALGDLAGASPHGLRVAWQAGRAGRGAPGGRAGGRNAPGTRGHHANSRGVRHRRSITFMSSRPMRRDAPWTWRDEPRPGAGEILEWSPA